MGGFNKREFGQANAGMGLRKCRFHEQDRTIMHLFLSCPLAHCLMRYLEYVWTDIIHVTSKYVKFFYVELSKTATMTLSTNAYVELN